jgi:hypothetical protein
LFMASLSIGWKHRNIRTKCVRRKACAGVSRTQELL